MKSFSKRPRAKCPDIAVLSAYLDSEVAPPWAREIEKHLKQCASCQPRFESLKRVKESLLHMELPNTGDSMKRIWSKMEASQFGSISYSVPLWKRRVSLPLPAMVGLAALILLLAVGNYFILARNRSIPLRITTEPDGPTEIHVSAPTIEDIQILLDSLEGTLFNKIQPATIELPDDTPFVILGEPVLLPATDFAEDRFK